MREDKPRRWSHKFRGKKPTDKDIYGATITAVSYTHLLGIIVKNNNVVVNEDMETNVPGIYAAGDCTGGLLQICKAIYEGAKCGLSIANQLKNI